MVSNPSVEWRSRRCDVLFVHAGSYPCRLVVRFGRRHRKEEIARTSKRGLQMDRLRTKAEVHALAIAPDTNVEMYRQAVAAEVQQGRVLIYLPAVASVMNAPMSTVPGTRLEFLLKADVPVLPIYVQRSLEIALDIEPRYDQSAAIFAIGKVLQGSAVSLAAYQESLRYARLLNPQEKLLRAEQP